MAAAAAIGDLPRMGVLLVAFGLACWAVLDLSIRLSPVVGRSIDAAIPAASLATAALVVAGLVSIGSSAIG